MDNIQFWIYVIFAVIYFFGRALRKKPQEKPKQRPRSPLETESESKERPVSFEDLLEEITGRKSLSDPQKSEPEIEEPEIEEAPPRPSRYERLKQEREAEKFEEGRTRTFSDEETRRVYEESIKSAEGYDLDYGTDEKYASKKVLRSTAEEEEDNEFVTEIKSMLQNKDEAKKAVILSEILNRKY